MRARLLALPQSHGADPAAGVLRSLAEALFPHIRELCELERRERELVDVLRTVPGPPRTLMAACRDGYIVGASRVGRRWLASRAAIDAYLRERGPRPVAAPDDDELEAVRRRLAAPSAPRRARSRGAR